MTVVATPTLIAPSAFLINGLGGVSHADTAVDAAAGNKIAGLDNGSLLVFRTTAASPITVTVYADVNGQECPIDSIVVPSNATFGGVRFYKPPKTANWQDHSVSSAAAQGSLVFKASGAALNVAAYPQYPAG